MKVVDVNVLVHAVARDSPRHQVARRWLDGALVGRDPVGFAWIVVVGFLRLMTHPGLPRSPVPLEAAVNLMRDWLATDAAVAIEPTPRHLDVLSGLLLEVGIGGNLVNDAHLAALAVEHDATVVSFDHDFGRFRGLRWQEPS
ncbi:MAG: type II toxin-antitoxin system VapC family toxin [Acidimicrobiales bacterium]